MGKQTRVRHSQAKRGPQGPLSGSSEDPHRRLQINASLAHLVGARGSLGSGADRTARAPPARPGPPEREAVATALASKLANAKGRHIRKKQRRFQRRRDAWEAGERGQPDPTPDDDAGHVEEEERDADETQPYNRADRHPDAPVSVYSTKAEKRKAIKKAKQAAKRAAEMGSSFEPEVKAAVQDESWLSAMRPATAQPALGPSQPATHGAQSTQARQQTLPMGVRILELESGNGPVVQDRSRVKVQYVGRLGSASGSIFDKSTISFRLGRGEVIKGWDIGVQGMRIGSKRRITVPPKAGYGAKGAGADIPPNSTLVFDIKALG
jgi:FKBP-type peptidyl-prolyl cis-trans isomerase